jgi:hypothetical protein
VQPENEEYGVPLAELEARMRPGCFSQSGFLGLHESLRQVLDADAQTLAELGVSAGDLAARLGELLEPAAASKAAVTRAGHYNIRIQRYKGPQICPFAPAPHENPCPGGGMRLASIDWGIENTRSRVKLSGPGLIVHLIDRHAFFEGLQSPYRVAPCSLAQLLELGPFAPAARIDSNRR